MLKKTLQFKKVYNSKKVISSDLLVMYYKKNNTSTNFYGITISKKVGKAVVRNRLRRIIKELLRSHLQNIKKGYDIVIVVRVRANTSDYKRLSKALFYMLKKGGFLDE